MKGWSSSVLTRTVPVLPGSMGSPVCTSSTLPCFFSVRAIPMIGSLLPSSAMRQIPSDALWPGWKRCIPAEWVKNTGGEKPCPVVRFSIVIS